MSLSFVQTAAEVIRLREFLKKHAKPGIQIKIDFLIQTNIKTLID
jgi:ribosomal protein L31E